LLASLSFASSSVGTLRAPDFWLVLKFDGCKWLLRLHLLASAPFKIQRAFKDGMGEHESTGGRAEATDAVSLLSGLWQEPSSTFVERVDRLEVRASLNAPLNEKIKLSTVALLFAVLCDSPDDVDLGESGICALKALTNMSGRADMICFASELLMAMITCAPAPTLRCKRSKE
jgi:hypothetical protein